MSLSEPARSDSTPEARSEPQGVEPSGNLPAPYVSPWQVFGRNLQAMAADLRLRAQELWRRNREGEHSVPGFWPRDLALSFWLLLLVHGVFIWLKDHYDDDPELTEDWLRTNWSSISVATTLMVFFLVF